MRKIYDRILAIRGSLITIRAKKAGLGELALIQKANGTSTLGSVVRFDRDLVSLQVFESTRGISTGDRVSFLGKGMQATFSL